MASFKKAVEEVLLWEGGYSHDPVDPGGETNFGISARSYPDIDISTLTLDDAIQIYYVDFWIAGKIYMVENQSLANKLFLMDVHSGIEKGTKLLQKALRSVHSPVLEDGVMGPETAGAVNSANPRSLLAAYRAECGAFYTALIYRKPQLTKYKNGWERRAYA